MNGEGVVSFKYINLMQPNARWLHHPIGSYFSLERAVLSAVLFIGLSPKVFLCDTFKSYFMNNYP